MPLKMALRPDVSLLGRSLPLLFGLAGAAGLGSAFAWEGSGTLALALVQQVPASVLQVLQARASLSSFREQEPMQA
jgi:hypothetical protein